MNSIECNLLIVEDDDVAVESIFRSLKKSDLSITATHAEDGLVALDILRGKHPTKKIRSPIIVLLDLNMPRMNGFEFLEVIRQDEQLRPLVVFILSTSGSDIDRSKAYHANIAGYMVKNNVGEQFSKLFSLLTTYVNTVELPNTNIPT